MKAPKKNIITKVIKAAVKSSKPSLKAAQKAKPLANPKSAVRLKGAAKPKPSKPDMAKLEYKKSSSKERAYNTAYRDYALDNTPRKAGSGVDRFMSFNDEANWQAGIAASEAQIGRKTKIGIQKALGIKQIKRPKKK